MNKFYILSIVFIGFLLMPMVSLACKSYSENNTCNIEIAANTNKIDCCKKNNDTKNKGCKEKCRHSNCTMSSTTSFITVFSEVKFLTNNFDLFEVKQNFFNSEFNLSSGFTSIWLIPKIS